MNSTILPGNSNKLVSPNQIMGHISETTIIYGQEDTTSINPSCTLLLCFHSQHHHKF